MSSPCPEWEKLLEACTRVGYMEPGPKLGTRCVAAAQTGSGSGRDAGPQEGRAGAEREAGGAHPVRKGQPGPSGSSPAALATALLSRGLRASGASALGVQKLSILE